MIENEPLLAEMRKIINDLQCKVNEQEREIIDLQKQNGELREAIAAFVNPGVPKILHTRDGIMVLD